MKSRAELISPIDASRDNRSISSLAILRLRRKRSSLRNSSQADRLPELSGVLSNSTVPGFARKNRSRRSSASTSARRLRTLSDGCRLPDSKCPTYGVEVFMRRPTSCCVRSSCRRRSRITCPKFRSFLRVIQSPQTILWRPYDPSERGLPKCDNPSHERPSLQHNPQL
jgi:hypothetical protein